MTKKHYIAIARIFNRLMKYYQEPEQRHILTTVIRSLMEYFQSINNKFDPDKFLAAIYEAKK